MLSEIELLKNYARSEDGERADITFSLTRSKKLFMIVEFDFGFNAYIVNEFNQVDKIGKLHYKIENDKMFIVYLESNLNKGEGIGTALLNKAKGIANLNACKQIYLNSLEKAEKFYEKLGFKAGGITENNMIRLKRYSFNPKNNFNER